MGADGDGQKRRGSGERDADQSLADGERRGFSVQRAVGTGIADDGVALAEHEINGPAGDRGGARYVGFGGKAGTFDAEKKRKVVVKAADRVRRAHEGEDGVLHQGGEVLDGAAAGGGVGAVAAGLIEHGGHVVGHGFAVQPAGRVEHGVELGVSREPAGVGAQESGDRAAIVAGGLRLPLQSRLRCVIQDYGFSPLG